MSAAGRIVTGAEIPDLSSVEVDFVVVGSGAGGSTAAAVLAAAGARVVVLEEGGHYTRRDFNMQESWAYPALYQEHGNRATDDLAILILQGRSVGGGTTVNWTSSFRTPERTLALWAARHGVRGLDAATLAPHFAAAEQRLDVGVGDPDDVNNNNRKLQEGAAKLGWRPELIHRSVKGCARLGYCGMGCPLDAKRTSRTTYLADAIAAGADVYSDCRAKLVETDRGRARAVVADVLDRASDRPRGRFVAYARRGIVLAGGAINTPALLLRSKAGTDSGQVGRRTFLHPTVPIVAFYDQPIEAFYGPPQSVSVHHFADRGERVGYFLETAPVHPMLAALAFPGFGDTHRKIVERLAFAQSTIALLIDGHHDDEGGVVEVNGDGRIKLGYPLHASLREAAVAAIADMARLQLAAGAREVMTLHETPLVIRSEADLGAIAAAPFGPNLHTMFSAHQMGGAAMGEDPARSVVDSRGRHHQLENLWIADGSVFPTSLGVNPQLSIYALARLFATEIAKPG
ncbi:MAG TPA: GMC family oxidoreductase [Polyangia bacterium]|jgi:choline dehydrogenase-like flavoprotein|nr:GMC family oxidoreductase [Polyangia bacterium]